MLALSKTKAEPVEFAIERLAPLGKVTLFNGPGSAGKSLLAQQFATCAAAGLPCLGLQMLEGPALYVTCEDDAEQLHWRLERQCKVLGIDMALLAGKLHMVSLCGELGNELALFAKDGKLVPTDMFNRLASTIRVTDAKLVFLDNVAHLFTGNENDRGEVTRFVNLLNRLAVHTGAAILLVGHPNKGGDTYSGSTAWLNAVRSHAWLDFIQEEDGTVIDTDARLLTVGKANYGPKGDVVSMRWYNWTFNVDELLLANNSGDGKTIAMPSD